MKKLYYIMPFIIVPSSMVLCECLDKANVIQMSPYIMGVVLFFLSVIMGNISPTENRFDKLITALMPLSLFAFMFVVGFLNQNDLHARFDIFRAIEVAIQPIALLLYVIMAVTTFLASVKVFRLFKRK